MSTDDLLIWEEVKEIAAEFIQVLEKYYPELTKKKYSEYGYPNREGIPAQDRMEFCVYMELMKAGAFNKFIGGPIKE